jgi:drug/metabolite transporter (DMT)-like permease
VIALPLSPAMRGLLLALLAGIFFQGLNATARQLSGELPPLFVAWGRWALGFACIAPFLLRSGFAAVHTRQLHLHGVRALFHGAGYGVWYTAVPLIPLAQTAALGFTGPIFVTIGAALFLGERLRLRGPAWSRSAPDRC